jgi:ABC-2 type transport system ATP-binding protein
MPGLESFNLESSADGNQLTYTYDPDVERTGITALLKSLNEVGIVLKDLQTSQSSLEEIFVRLVNTR